MLQQPVSTYFLHVYDVESGLWVQTTLGSGVSPRIQEAMNLILRKDGILGFIGTKSEFGLYLSELKNTHGKDFRHCWTSLPASTIMSMLGLCLNMPMSERPELVFHGSPLVLVLAYILDMEQNDLQVRSFIESHFQNAGLFVLETSMQEQIGLIQDRSITHSEYQEALSYLEESSKVLSVEIDPKFSHNQEEPDHVE